MTTFNEFNLNEDILKAVSLMGFEEATPIQEQAIPVALAGEDLIGLAHTGTGKTAAFGIPLAQRLQADNHQIQALVVTPTRELAMQVAEELNRPVCGAACYHLWSGYRPADPSPEEETVDYCRYRRLLDHLGAAPYVWIA